MKLLILFVAPVFFSFSINQIECEDILTKYAQKPAELEYVKCDMGTGQTIVEASYQVTGAQSKIVEDFLVKIYSMGELTFNCCGWEPKDGKTGQFTGKELQAIDPNYVMVISMTGNAEIKNRQGEINLEKDRNKIPYFIVTVKLMDV